MRLRLLTASKSITKLVLGLTTASVRVARQTCVGLDVALDLAICFELIFIFTRILDRKFNDVSRVLAT